jgi:hypothetical protein
MVSCLYHLQPISVLLANDDHRHNSNLHDQSMRASVHNHTTSSNQLDGAYTDHDRLTHTCSLLTMLSCFRASFKFESRFSSMQNQSTLFGPRTSTPRIDVLPPPCSHTVVTLRSVWTAFDGHSCFHAFSSETVTSSSKTAHRMTRSHSNMVLTYAATIMSVHSSRTRSPLVPTTRHHFLRQLLSRSLAICRCRHLYRAPPHSRHHCTHHGTSACSHVLRDSTPYHIHRGHQSVLETIFVHDCMLASSMSGVN